MHDIVTGFEAVHFVEGDSLAALADFGLLQAVLQVPFKNLMVGIAAKLQVVVYKTLVDSHHNVVEIYRANG